MATTTNTKSTVILLVRAKLDSCSATLRADGFVRVPANPEESQCTSLHLVRAASQTCSLMGNSLVTMPLTAVLTLAHSGGASSLHLITSNDVIEETVTFSLLLVQ